MACVIFCDDVFGLNGGLFGGSALYLNDYLWHWKPNELRINWIYSTSPGVVAAAFSVMSVTKRFDDKKAISYPSCLVAFITGPIFIGLRLLIFISGPTISQILVKASSVLCGGSFSLNGFVETFLWRYFWILVASMFSDIVEEQKSETGSQ